MKRHTRVALFLLIPFLLVCTSNKNPFSEAPSAAIVKDSSLTSLRDSIKITTAVSCTVSLNRPDLIDSFLVRSTYQNKDSILASSKQTAGKVFFTFAPVRAGTYQITVVIVRADNTSDSIAKTVIVYIPQPNVVPDSLAYHVNLPADSVTLRFTITDPDSNLRFAYTWLDTAEATTETTPITIPLKAFRATITRTIKGGDLIKAMNTPLVCHILAFDADSLVSKAMACTLLVKDPLPPVVSLLSPDTTIAITTLPLVISAIVRDLSGVNSVSFNGSAMTRKGDTVSYSTASLDTGSHIDSIVATDNAGNSTHFRFSVTYHGKKVFAPRIRDLISAKTEGTKFDTLFLDTCVEIPDPEVTDKIAFKRDSLDWSITDSLGDKIAINSHRIVVPQPIDTEWHGTIRLTFKVSLKNNPVISDTKEPAFILIEVPDPPVITLSSISVCGGTSVSDTIYLDTITTVRDPDNALSTLQWNFTNGKHYKVDSLISSYIIKPTLGKTSTGPIIPILRGSFTRHIQVVPIAVSDTSFYGTDTLTFSVTDKTTPPTIKKIPFYRNPKCYPIFP
jgi:hypothetical protein